MDLLSIVICKHNVDLFQECVKSIKNTLIQPYELIIVDNTENRYDIFTAYNEGINRSSGDIICFIHEDVICHEEHWGEKVKQHFEDDMELGMIGIAGGASYHKFAWSWNQTYYKNDFAISIASKRDGKLEHTKTGFKSNTKQVLIIDGLWFCIRRKVLQEHHIKFDKSTFKGFHRYDYDISFQIAQVAKIKVVSDIKLEHKSSGSRNKNWMQANIDFQEKWSHLLPCKIDPIKLGIVKLAKREEDIRAFYSFLFLLNDHNFSQHQINKVIRNHFFIASFLINIQLKIVIIYIIGFKNFYKLKKGISLKL